MRGKWRAQRADGGAHAARGFVGGATIDGLVFRPCVLSVSMPHAALWVVQPQLGCSTRRVFSVSMPHAALWVVQHPTDVGKAKLNAGFNAARGFVGGAAIRFPSKMQRLLGFNAARGFVGGAALFISNATVVSVEVSMPHAALWVVQPSKPVAGSYATSLFQCRTRLCEWCSPKLDEVKPQEIVVSMPHAALWVVQLPLSLG